MSDRPSRWALARTDLRWYGRRRQCVALLRSLWWTIVRGHYSELCQVCGRPYRHWLATDYLWNAVMGEPDWRARHGEFAYQGVPGLSCPDCFDRQATRCGFTITWLTGLGAEVDSWYERSRQAKLNAGEFDDDLEHRAALESDWRRAG